MARTRVRRRVGVAELNSYSSQSHHRRRRRSCRCSRHHRRLHQRRHRFYLRTRVCRKINEISWPVRIKYSAAYLCNTYVYYRWRSLEHVVIEYAFLYVRFEITCVIYYTE